ncbi:MAG: PEP-CTERM sorting domain-containing protein [Planctomycetota bacterium]|nr:MAG: PEP-CTERM sorting domain-containing protein [Planctomycetota bacterium]
MRKTAIIAALAAAAGTAAAGPDQAPSVSYSVSGTSGAYVLDFSVGASFDDQMGIYFFGVVVDTGRNIAGSPAGWDPNAWSSWDNSPYGGSSTIYNNIWIDNTVVGIQDGQTLSGFQVNYTGASAPASVDWYAFGANGDYTGSDPFFNNTANPGFEGTAFIPAPGALALLGLGGIASIRRRR